MFATVDQWFDQGRELFEFTPSTPPDSLEFQFEMLAYLNQQIWCYEDFGRSADPELVVMGWRGAQRCNQQRNAAINAIDALLRPLYRPDAELHSETLGSIADRITIQYLKFHNFVRRDPAAAAALRGHIDELVACGQALLDGIRAGRKRCLELPRMKLYFAAEASRA
ncbi:MAG: DUF4254 domain-containing protein [Planctomycetes bacterium]|nr:DUF4254 domain-containing protein [Planctomycetota bacterium]